MRKCFLTMVLFFAPICCLNSLPDNDRFDIKFIKSIGDERDNYIFFKISGGLISPEKEIYIGDRGGYFVAKYSWDGRYLSRVGKRGQGPNDFLHNKNIAYADRKIYVNDLQNMRIAIMDTDLKLIEYIKTGRNIRSDMYVTGNGSILCDGTGVMGEIRCRVQLLSPKGDLIKCFFDRTQFGKSKSEKNALQWAVNKWTSRIRLGYSKSKSEVIISFNYPVNPVNFFIYDLNGKPLREFNYYPEKKYQFPKYLRSYPLKIPTKKAYHLTLSSIFSYKDYFVVFLDCHLAEKGQEKIGHSKYLVFDQKGNLLAGKSIKKNLEFFNITGDGYLIGINPDGEIPRALIYKLLF